MTNCTHTHTQQSVLALYSVDDPYQLLYVGQETLRGYLCQNSLCTVHNVTHTHVIDTQLGQWAWVRFPYKSISKTFEYIIILSSKLGRATTQLALWLYFQI